MTDDLKKAATDAALALVNQERVWLTTNKIWVMACVAFTALGFILGKIF